MLQGEQNLQYIHSGDERVQADAAAVGHHVVQAGEKNKRCNVHEEPNDHNVGRIEVQNAVEPIKRIQPIHSLLSADVQLSARLLEVVAAVQKPRAALPHRVVRLAGLEQLRVRRVRWSLANKICGIETVVVR